MSKALKQYITSFFLATSLIMMICLLKEITNKTEIIEILHILIDATFAVSVCFVGFGLLCFATNEGTFDMISYGVGQFLSFFKKDRSEIKYKNFVEYKESRMEKKITFGYIIFIGLFYLIVSLVLLVIYNNLK